MEGIGIWNNFIYPILVLVIGTLLVGGVIFLVKRWWSNRNKLDKIIELQTKHSKMINTISIGNYAVRKALIKGTNGNGEIFEKTILEAESEYKSTLKKLGEEYYED